MADTSYEFQRPRDSTVKKRLVDIGNNEYAEQVVTTLVGSDGADAGESHLGEVSSWLNSIYAVLTRPGDTAAYTANDGVSNSTSAPTAIQFTNAIRSAAGKGVIIGAYIIKSSTTTTNAQFRLHLYSGSPSSVPNDNAAFANLWANRTIYIGYIDFSGFIAGSDCAIATGILSRDSIVAKLVSGTTIFGIFQAVAAYAPASGEQFEMHLDIIE